MIDDLLRLSHPVCTFKCASMSPLRRPEIVSGPGRSVRKRSLVLFTASWPQHLSVLPELKFSTRTDKLGIGSASPKYLVTTMCWLTNLEPADLETLPLQFAHLPTSWVRVSMLMPRTIEMRSIQGMRGEKTGLTLISPTRMTSASGRSNNS